MSHSAGVKKFELQGASRAAMAVRLMSTWLHDIDVDPPPVNTRAHLYTLQSIHHTEDLLEGIRFCCPYLALEHPLARLLRFKMRERHRNSKTSCGHVNAVCSTTWNSSDNRT